MRSVHLPFIYYLLQLTCDILFINYHYCPIKIWNCSLKLLKYSWLQRFFERTDLKL